MNRKWYMKGVCIVLCLGLSFSVCACSNKKSVTNNSENTKVEATPSASPTVAEKENNEVEGDDTMTTDKDQGIDEAKKLEAQGVEDAAEPSEEPVEDAPASISDKIPSKYFTKRKDHCGTIEHIEYKTKDYYGDEAELTKGAYVYLPYDYDESKQYNVLYLLHGIGGNEKEWGMCDDNSRVKAMMDNLAYYQDIEPFIVVAPNGRSSADFANTNADYNSFYVFGKELRNDLIPFVESKYSTYTKVDDLSASRDHRAVAGLSMGGMQTINIGLCECLDLFSNFGAFSAAPTTNPASKIVAALKEEGDYNINYFYNICGTTDNIALQSATGAAETLCKLTDKVVDGKNFMWQTLPGNHDFNIWYLGFYNFAQLTFKDTSK